MQIGHVYQGSEHYGGHYHCLGLFVVVKIGKKFTSLKQIECVEIETPIENVTPVDYHSHGKRKAIVPFQVSGRTVLIAHDNYFAEDDRALTPNGGSMCYKNFERVLPNAENEYIFTSSSTHYD